MIKLVDQLSPMGNFAVATATDIVCSDNERLQDKIDNGTLGGDTSLTVTEAEYLALPEEQKLNNSYYLYDIGVHYKNGVAYSRKKPIQLTMEEYKALGEVDPDQEYIVSANEQGILLGAEDIGYSNAVSNLPCTTVQGAIDKVNANLGELIKTKVISGTSSTNGNYNLELSGDKYVVLSANYVGIADNTIQVLPYLSNGNTWWATCIGINEEDVVHRYKNTDFTVRVTYIELP